MTTQKSKTQNTAVDHTFVITTYGDSSFLNECIESVLAQTQKSNVLLSTGTPSPFIRETAEKYGIPLVVNDKEPTISNNWNFALRSCKTRYCTLAHQDDIYLPEYTERMLKAIKKNPQNIIAFSDYAELKNGSRRFWLLYLIVKRLLLFPFYLKRSWEMRFFRKSILRLGCAICCPSVLFNLDMLEGFEFSSNFSINLDWDAWLNMTERKGGFCFVPKALMLHRISSECETSTGLNDNRRQNEDKIIFERLWPKYIASILTKFYEFCYSNSQG